MLAFKLAVTMQAMQQKTSVFLTLAATRWGFQGTAKDLILPGEPSLEEFIDSFIESDGELLICSPCIEAYCYLPGLEEEFYQEKIRPNSRYVGLATIAEKMFDGEATVF